MMETFQVSFEKDITAEFVFLEFFQEGTHIVKAPYNDDQLKAMLIRTECLLSFIIRISKGEQRTLVAVFMSPVVHQRMYPEIESSCLLRYNLRILVEPACISRIRRSILDIDTLRKYLKDLNSPCCIVLILPAHSAGEFDKEYAFMGRIGVEILPSANIVHPEADNIFPNQTDLPRKVITLASTALIGDADIVLSDLAVQPEIVKQFLKLNIALQAIDQTKRNCEVFVRGHEIPWNFNHPPWWMVWNPFYAMTEADIRVMEQLRALAYNKGMSRDICEHIRSLGYNRWSAIAYTRDKLQFYVLQRRATKRNKLKRQDFSFELAHHLNHYFLLFWGALDQMCWIVNGICNLGFKPKQWRQVGVTKKDFLKCLAESDPSIALEFKQDKFLHWIRILN